MQREKGEGPTDYPETLDPKKQRDRERRRKSTTVPLTTDRNPHSRGHERHTLPGAVNPGDAPEGRSHNRFESGRAALITKRWTRWSKRPGNIGRTVMVRTDHFDQGTDTMNTYRVDIAQELGNGMVTFSHTVTMTANTETGAIVKAQGEADDGFTAMWASYVPNQASSPTIYRRGSRK